MYAFGISMGNEDYPTWTLFNKLFKRACPMISEVEMGQKYSKFVFITDQDKGLEKSLQEVSPSNHATHCAHYIKQNVSMRYGKPYAEFVSGLTSSYSLAQQEKFIKCIQSLNSKAMAYLSKIPLHH